MKCEFCNNDSVIEVIDDFDTREVNYKNERIIIKSVKSFKCSSCHETWIESDELTRIQTSIEKQKYELLTPSLITKIREALPITSKRNLANFLCLNEKAFVKWEKGHYEPNRANDLLLRLIAFSEENFKFVQNLHDNKFKFEAADYYFLKGISLCDSPPQAADPINQLPTNPLLIIGSPSDSKTSEVESYNYAMAA